MRHERAIWEIRQAAAAPSSRAEGLQTESLARLPWREFSRLVPCVDGVLRIETFDCDPVALTDRVLADAPPRRLRRRARLLVYWTDRSAAQLRTLTVETLPALLLSQVNGRRRSARSWRRSAGTAWPRRRLPPSGRSSKTP